MININQYFIIYLNKILLLFYIYKGKNGGEYVLRITLYVM